MSRALRLAALAALALTACSRNSGPESVRCTDAAGAVVVDVPRATDVKVSDNFMLWTDPADGMQHGSNADCVAGPPR